MCNEEKLIKGKRNEREDFKFWFGMTEQDADFYIRLENTHPASKRSREKPAFLQSAPPLPTARQARQCLSLERGYLHLAAAAPAPAAATQIPLHICWQEQTVIS